MDYRCAILIPFFALFVQKGAAKNATESFRIHTDLPYVNKEKKLLLDVFYTSDSAFSGSLRVQFYQYRSASDSVLVLHKQSQKTGFKSGTNKIKIDFSKDDTDIAYNKSFYEILKRTNAIPPGSYKVFLSVQNSANTFNFKYIHEIDSVLSPNSPVRKDITQSISPKAKSFLGMHLKNRLPNAKSPAATTAMQHKKNKIEKTARKRGLTPVQYEKNNKSYIDLYYEDWFAGRYEVNKDEPVSNEAKLQDKFGSPAQFNSLTTNSLDHPSLFSQYKSLNKDKKEQEEMKGEISLTTNLSSGQEQYSSVDNNYYELRGRIEMPILGLPVELEGMYTSQDMNRKIKSSYFRAHYDVEKVKDGLSQSLKSYNGKYAETRSKGIGMEQVYGTGIANLEGQKAKLQNEINISSGSKNNSDDKLPLNDSSLVSGAEKDAGSQTAEKQKELEDKRRKLAELDRKIERYKTLLEQNKNTNYFDSTLGYARTKGISNPENMSYKQMSKMGVNMLPDGRAKSFLAGVTTVDAGMFPKNASKYTMNGQMMKGLDFGYDLGFCETGVTVGKTQYIGRDGSMDQFTCYAAKASFKPAKTQKLSLLYYGYTPDRKLLAGDDFFKNANIAAPSFFRPVSIISTSYDGQLSKFVTVGGEAATSIKERDKKDVLSQASQEDKMAYHLNIDGTIPLNTTAINLQGAYDKTGKAFENSTLPVSLSGTQQYKLAGRTDLLKSLLTLGIEYNHLIQNNFSSQGSNTKWGFDVKISVKRYPSLFVSYKPFTTFHSYTDTLNIPQRPLFGSVWTGKTTYQIKRKDKSLRFSILYNRNVTVMDTSHTGNVLLQATCMYSDKQMTNSVTLGYMELSGTNIVQTIPSKTNFLSLTTSYKLNKSFNISGGQDFGLASFGFCRYAITGGLGYRPEKYPVSVRLSMRYNTYQLSEGETWKHIYSGYIDLGYRFKSKIEKNKY